MSKATKDPMEQPLIVSDHSQGTVSASPLALAHRNQVTTNAARIVAVKTPEDLKTATQTLKDLGWVIGCTNESRLAITRPIDKWVSEVIAFEKDFVAPAQAQKLRLTGLVNHYQRKQLEEAEARTKAAEAAQRKAEQEAASAQEAARKLQEQLEATNVSAKNKRELEAKLLDAQLAAEEAAMDATPAAPSELAPVNPAGLVTKSRLGFQITDPFAFVQGYPEFWKWDEDKETLKLDRRKLLEALNQPAPNTFQWLKFPEEQPVEGIPKPPGVRVFKEVSSHVRQ